MLQYRKRMLYRHCYIPTTDYNKLSCFSLFEEKKKAEVPT